MSCSLLHLKGRTALQPVSAALEMNPKERALYLKQRHTGVTLTDDEATVASATAAGLRSFLRQASSFCSAPPCLQSRLCCESFPASDLNWLHHSCSVRRDQEVCQALLSPCRCERSCIRSWAA